MSDFPLVSMARDVEGRSRSLEPYRKRMAELKTPEIVDGFDPLAKIERRANALRKIAREELLKRVDDGEGVVGEDGDLYLFGTEAAVRAHPTQKRELSQTKLVQLLKKRRLFTAASEEVVEVKDPASLYHELKDLAETVEELQPLLKHFSFRREVREQKVEALVLLGKLTPGDLDAASEVKVGYVVSEVERGRAQEACGGAGAAVQKVV